MKNIAVITGASSGMGREFLTQLDRGSEFDELWAVSRRADRLEAITDTRAAVRVFAVDLCDASGVDTLSAALEAEKPNVTVLVNASGFGRFGAFSSLTINEQLEMMTLNNTALVKLTHATLPYMQKGGRIFNLGSLSAFQPVPGMAVYAASKAFVLSFSRALNVEQKPRGVRVMAVCPGWVRTEFFNRAKTDDTVTYYNRYHDAPAVVKRALSDMKKGRDVSVCGLTVRNQVRMVKLFPHKFVMRVWCGQQKFKDKGTFDK